MKLEAYVTNLGMYNEGYLNGEWVQFPITEEEQEQLFNRIGISDEPDENGIIYEEYFMTDYESDIDLYSLFGEYVSIDTLNELAERIEDLSDYEQKVLEAIIDSGAESDVYNALDNIDNYGLAEGVTGAEYEEQLTIECYPEIDFDRLGWISSYITIDYEQMFRDDDSVWETDLGILYEC